MCKRGLQNQRAHKGFTTVEMELERHNQLDQANFTVLLHLPHMSRESTLSNLNPHPHDNLTHHHFGERIIHSMDTAKEDCRREAIANALVDRSLETGHKGEFRGWPVTRLSRLKDGRGALWRGLEHSHPWAPLVWSWPVKSISPTATCQGR